MTSPTALEVVDGVDLTGKVCVITGASAGLGRESARALAKTGAHVILAARNRQALDDTEAWVRAEVPGAQTSTVQLDLTSLASIRSAAEAISAAAPAIHVLMNNAGVMFTPFGRTAEGFEMQFGTNHLGHFELTRLLTPQLVAAGGARIVTLSSDGHRLSDVNLDDPNWERRQYDKFAAYGASKTANVLHVIELDRRLRDQGVRAYAVHPGVVATSLARHMSRDDFIALTQLVSSDSNQEKVDVRRDFTVPEQGAATQVWAAVSGELADVGSVYLADCRIQDDLVPYAVDESRARQLWDISESLCAVAVPEGA
ncbi:short-chain dehydrogenase [Mycolicibacterium moriokaense]|uniref:Oxidoreductase n=1 Tax=Mycolicibacterium moriokaense TaxID=39691 RepID=A0AAD1HAD3_9MYCO|nr:SDR family NAD(P)-dependent oxidoreductase [Mycolicibacterium moriokaense]MCV7042792.1 SDR family NAD(P)-dependent oxidoreductase [Mycolicibacterium moriokaense]ORB12377.1 short-chain dehydrogenase [Mycolicibacterium moriokaense]BBX01071.1 oxidoreductase [Mycolicibacterium moriokaense]